MDNNINNFDRTFGFKNVTDEDKIIGNINDVRMKSSYMIIHIK